MYIVLLVLIIVFAFASPSFFKPQNLINVVNQCVYLIIVGVGVTLIMLSGAIDLSIGYQMSIMAVVMGLMARDGYNSFVIIIVCLVLGVGLSTINGLIYARLKVFPFIITLATQYVFYGVTYLLSNAKTFTQFTDAYKFLGQRKFEVLGVKFPYAILIMAIVVLVGSFVLNRTYFGRNIYALGSNPSAVSLSGVSVAKIRILVFSIAGLFFSLGTVMYVSRIGSASSTNGVGAEFTAMAGAMLGGVKMGGGGGKMSNMVIGMFILQILQNGMNLMNLNTYWQNVAMGAILLVAITVDTLQTESVMRAAKKVAGKAPKQ